MKKTPSARAAVIAAAAAVLIFSSCVISFEKPVTYLDAPAGLTVTYNTKNSADIRWNTVLNATRYYVFASLSQDETDAFLICQTEGTAALDTNLSYGKTYWYYVLAFEHNEGIESEKSSVCSYTVPPDPGLIITEKPVILSAVFTGKTPYANTVTFAALTGADNAADVSEYRVYRSLVYYGDADTFDLAGTVSAGTILTGPVSFTDTDISISTLYIYYVQAFTAEGQYSEPSDPIYCMSSIPSNTSLSTSFDITTTSQETFSCTFPSRTASLWFSLNAAHTAYTLSVSSEDTYSIEPYTSGPAYTVYKQTDGVLDELTAVEGIFSLATPVSISTEKNCRYIIIMYCAPGSSQNFELTAGPAQQGE